MSESIQFSVEQINFVAAQLRYKIESALQSQSLQQQLQAPIIKEELVSTGEIEYLLPDEHVSSNDKLSVAAALENDFLHREVLDLKQVVDKLSLQLRSKETALRLSKEELKQTKFSAEAAQRELKQISADTKAHERYIKCVQIEYELLHNMSIKSQESFLLIGAESVRKAAEFDNVSKVVKKQLKEIIEKKLENQNLQEEVKRLTSDLTNQRAAAGVTTNMLKQLQLQVDRSSEKELALLTRVTAISERLEKERHLYQLLTHTVEESEQKATAAFEGINAASLQQSVLIKRLKDFSGEISFLKESIAEQQQLAVQKEYDEGGSKILSVTSSRILHLNDSGTTVNTQDEQGFAVPLPLIQQNEVSEGMPVQRDVPSRKAEGAGSQMEQRGEVDGGWDDMVPEVLQDAPKKRRTETLVLPESTSAALIHQSAIDRQRESDKLCAPMVGGDKIPSGPAVGSGTEGTCSDFFDDGDIDGDERCPSCQDTPFGLMVVCMGCKRGIHSACAKKTAGYTAAGKSFRCSLCIRK